MAISTIAPAAQAECDISETKCALNGSKCNIHFKNRTGDSGGSDGSSALDQRSAAQAVEVKAIDENSDRVGNKLVIQVSSSKTMNITKKDNKGFDRIRITSQNAPKMYDGVAMSCAHIIETLNGSGTCKIFQGTRAVGGDNHGRLGYQCDGGDVGGPN
jgi:hypothetical protein